MNIEYDKIYIYIFFAVHHFDRLNIALNISASDKIIKMTCDVSHLCSIFFASSISEG